MKIAGYSDFGYMEKITNDIINQGTYLQSVEKGQRQLQTARTDKFELSEDGKAQLNILNVSDKITMEMPRERSIFVETLESRINHIQNSLKKADSMNLSFNERLDFLKEAGERWIRDIRKNDPYMFQTYLKMKKGFIQDGHADLVGLPLSK